MSSKPHSNPENLGKHISENLRGQPKKPISNEDIAENVANTLFPNAPNEKTEFMDYLTNKSKNLGDFYRLVEECLKNGVKREIKKFLDKSNKTPTENVFNSLNLNVPNSSGLSKLKNSGFSLKFGGGIIPDSAKLEYKKAYENFTLSANVEANTNGDKRVGFRINIPFK